MRRFRSEGGFTMVEMITTMTILAILSVFSVKPMGRYIAKARQAEAKTTLGHVSTLQSVHAIDKQTYADAGTSGTYGGGQGSCSVASCTTQASCTTAGTCNNNSAGSWTATAKDCSPGALGLKLQGCKEMRYKYTIKGDTNGHYAIAEVHGESIIFGCKVTGSPVPTTIISYTGTATAGEGTRHADAAITLSTAQEDIHFVTEEAGLTTAFDVTENCN